MDADNGCGHFVITLKAVNDDEYGERCDSGIEITVASFTRDSRRVFIGSSRTQCRVEPPP